MTVHVLIREDQNDYGYVDTSITGVFRHKQDAEHHEAAARARVYAEGLRADDEDTDIDWEVSWKIEEHDID
jgi:hypothetical protein